MSPGAAPYLYLACGDREGLLAVNRQFAGILAQRAIRHEFQVVHGGHDWESWNEQLADMFEALVLTGHL